MSKAFTIANLAQPNKVLDLANKDKTTVFGWPKNGGNNQKWTFVDNGDGTYQIQNVQHQRFLGIDAQARVPIGVVNPSQATAWAVEYVGLNICHIRVATDWTVLDLGSGAPDVYLSTVNGANSQTWELRPAGC